MTNTSDTSAVPSRHAFLIMAHEQPQLLQRLVDRLDDERTDIYLHVDSEAPFDGSEISTRRSRLLMVEPRVDVRWGHTSQIEAEYALLEASADGDYSYRHIISGTHWPLRPVGEILDWFDAQEGRTVLPEGEWTDWEIRQKLGYYHFGLGLLRSRNRLAARAGHLWHTLTLALQRGWVRRDYSYFHGKHSNWVSVGRDDLPAVLQSKAYVLRRMHHAFCADEIFIPAILHACGSDCLISPDVLFTDFTPAGPRTLTAADLDALTASGCFFARKVHLPESAALIDQLP